MKVLRFKRVVPTTIQGYLKYAMIGIALLVVAGLPSEYMSLEVILGVFVVEVVLALFVVYFDYVEKKEASD